MTAIKYKENGEWKTLTMPSAVHIGTAAPDEDVKQLWVDTYAVTPPYGYVPPIVSSLPAAPFDGQTVSYLADATNGVIWTLRYRAASLSAYKWEFVGGSSLFMAESAGHSPLTSTVAIDKNGGPNLVIPLSGDYEMTYTAEVYTNPNAYCYCGWHNPANVLVGPWLYHGSFSGFGATVTTMQKLSSLAAMTLKARVYVGGGSGYVQGARISARPIRVAAS